MKHFRTPVDAGAVDGRVIDAWPFATAVVDARAIAVGVVAGIVAASAIAAVTLGVAGAAKAAPSVPTTAEQTVNQLEDRGIHVIVNKLGTMPLDRCVVDSVRPGQTFARMDSGAPGADEDIVTTVTSMTVYLDVSC